LWATIERRSRKAMAEGALCPIETRCEEVEDAGIRFTLRVAANIARKENVDAQHRHRDPFAPFERDLFVTDIGATHMAPLNKFSVIDRHLLVVTRAYEDQETLLTLADFEALSVCLAAYPALGFYNAGEVAGASQRHKHLQVVPLHGGDPDPMVPVQPLLAAAPTTDTVTRVPALPFANGFCRLPAAIFRQPSAAAPLLLRRYRDLLEEVGVKEIRVGNEARQSMPYNLLVTARWMLLVPRSRECFGNISVNALGYTGSFFLRDEEQLAALRRAGPMTVLRAVSVTP
jgi:sulfate adenylyltransferase (ADP) / ATP adenylyltransferase